MSRRIPTQLPCLLRLIVSIGTPPWKWWGIITRAEIHPAVAAPWHITRSANPNIIIAEAGNPPLHHLRPPLTRDSMGKKAENGLDIIVCHHSYLLILLPLTLCQDHNHPIRITLH